MRHTYIVPIDAEHVPFYLEGFAIYSIQVIGYQYKAGEYIFDLDIPAPNGGSGWLENTHPINRLCLAVGYAAVKVESIYQTAND